MAVDIDSRAALVGLKALAEPLRWRIVELLAREELCVCHLVEELGVAQPLVSHHLGVLRRAGLVESERFRLWTYYRLCPQGLETLAGSLVGMAEGASGSSGERRPCC